jgi:curli biogenesis system outer membrane secretion channel CsgG
MTQPGIAKPFRRPAIHPLRLAAVLGVALAALAAAPAEAAPRAKRPRIALLDFPAASNAWSCSGWANSEGRMSAVLRDLYTSEISDLADGKVRLVERERLADVRGELAFQQGAEVDGATAQKLGKLLGVQFVITGKITRFACKKTDAGTGWGVGALVGRATGSSFAGDVAGSVKTKKVTFSGRIDARLIDVRTGEIMGTWKEENETGDLSVGVAGGGVDVAYDDELASKVFEPIASRMAEKMVPKILKAAKEREADDEEAEDEEPAPRKKVAVAADDSGGSGSGAQGGKRGGEAAAASGGGQGGAASGQVETLGEVYSPRFDFVPGENVLFFDDYSDTEPGDYPSRWRVGGERAGQMEVVELKGQRWFKSIKPAQGDKMLVSSTAMRADCAKRSLPAKFTVEFDVPSSANFQLWFEGHSSPHVDLGPTFAASAGATATGLAPPTKPIRHVSVAVSGSNLKLYFDGERVLMDPDGVPTNSTESTRKPCNVAFAFRPDGDAKSMWWGGSGPFRDDLMFTNFKLAEGGKDYTKDLAISGRIVTHGITFDSGSDRIRPESGPTLRKILKLLQDDSGLSFEVQGHTDAQGGEKVNGPLSERRAAAVKAWLVAQGIEDGRLTTRGLGATKPLKENDTLEGRADNRRVEFVKRGG